MCEYAKTTAEFMMAEADSNRTCLMETNLNRHLEIKRNQMLSAVSTCSASFQPLESK